MRNRELKKWLALLLVLMLGMSLCCAALADGEDSGDVASTPLETQTEPVETENQEIPEEPEEPEETENSEEPEEPEEPEQPQYDINAVRQALAAYAVSQVGTYEDDYEELQNGTESWDSGRQQYQSGLSSYNAGLAEYNAGLAEYEDGKRQYDSGMAE